MRRKSDTPTRSDVECKVEESNNEMSEHLEELDVIATDKETVTETLESLDFNGTSEGSDEVEGAIEQAENVTVERFDEEDEMLREIQNESAAIEAELQERSDSSESDCEKVSDTIGRITTEEAKSELQQAESEIGADIEFLDSQNEAAREAREENEQLQQEARSRVQGTKR